MLERPGTRISEKQADEEGWIKVPPFVPAVINKIKEIVEPDPWHISAERQIKRERDGEK